MVAAGNVVYHFYRLTFYAVVLISTQMGQYGGTLEAFAPLLWAFIGIPIHFLGVLQLRLCRVPLADDAASPSYEMKSLLVPSRQTSNPMKSNFKTVRSIRFSTG
jgi:hypothetical protein